MSHPSVQPALARARSALVRGDGAAAAQILASALRSAALSRTDETDLRCALAEAWLLQDDMTEAVAALGRPPDAVRADIDPARLSALWRLHGRLAQARGDRARAIALFGRALKHANIAHDSRGIGLAHYELALCYSSVGDMAIVREHLNKAAAALHAADDRRHLALLHSLSGVVLAQMGRYGEATAALRQAERLAAMVEARDVLATVCGNQANVALMQHRHDQALALAEHAVALHESAGSAHGLAVALATLGQICVRLGSLERAEQALHRALAVRSPVKFHEITGAVFDTLAQIHLMRGAYGEAAGALQQAADAYGAWGRQTSRWYEWSVRTLHARLALLRGDPAEALRLAEAITSAEGAPPVDLVVADLIATEALLAGGSLALAEQRLAQAEGRLDPRATPGLWGEYLRLRGEVQARAGRSSEAYHDLGQSISIFELHGEIYQAGLSHLALGRFAVEAGARSIAERHLREAEAIFQRLGATPHLETARGAAAGMSPLAAGPFVGSLAGSDDVLVRRLVDAAVLPDLLARETAAALLEASGGELAALFLQTSTGELRVIARAGGDGDAASALARAVAGERAGDHVCAEPLGRDPDGQRMAAVLGRAPLADLPLRRLRTVLAVARLGFELCAARDRPVPSTGAAGERPLEPLFPGFLCASAAMGQVAAQIQRMQGNDLPVLVTGESGTGKELVARAIHHGSLRSAGTFLPYNCTTTTRELADSQLFGHRRGSFTGAVTDQPGLIRSAAAGTLFLDEIGDLPLEIQPKLLRVLEYGEIIPVGATRPQHVDVRIVAATNVDLDQRVSEGKFREDLFYRLSVIRIHVPPLRERLEEIPHLSALFLREACERLGKPDIRLSPEALDLFATFWWPGNVRQLRNEIQRAVAMSPPEGVIFAEHLSPDLAVLRSHASLPVPAPRPAPPEETSLGDAVDRLERELIRAALDRTGGNISRSARQLGVTRRGLYLKIRRLGLESLTNVDTK